MEKNLKYPFKFYKAQEHFEDFAKKPVLVEGMRLVEMCYVKVTDIDTEHYNFGRVEGKTDSPHIVKLRIVFRKDQYEPQFHEPPVITKEGKLVAGKHRFVSARLEKVEYIWVAICTFATTKSTKQYAITENLRKHPKNEADQGAVVYNVISAIQAGDCNKNAHSIRQYLKEIDWNTQVAKTVELILSSVIDDYKQTTNPTRDDIVDAVMDEYDVDVTQAPQCLLVKGLDVNVAVGFSDTLAKDIPQNREHINDNYVQQYIDQCVQVADAYKSGNLGNINFLFKTQIEGEDGHFVEINS